MESYLNSDCLKNGICRNEDCKDAVKKSPFDRWFITIGHAGFNSKANNYLGYSTKAKALSVMKNFLRKGDK